MSSKQLYFAMLAIIGLLVIGLLGGAYASNKILLAESNHLVGSRLQAAVLDQEQEQLATAKQEIKKYQDLATIADSVVPQDKDQAQTLQQIVNIANANGITLGSIKFPSASLGNTGTSTSKQALLSQLVPVKGISGVYDLQITVQSDSNHPVSFSSFINFLSSLEHNRRTALVNSIALQPNSKDRSTLSFTLGLDEYIKP